MKSSHLNPETLALLMLALISTAPSLGHAQVLAVPTVEYQSGPSSKMDLPNPQVSLTCSL